MICERVVSAYGLAEIEQLAVVIADWSAPDYVTIRAIVAAGSDADERAARLTAMGREFVVDVRRRMRSDGAAALLAAPPTPHERILENATRQLAGGGARKPTMQRLSRETGIPRRTVYNLYSASQLAAACRRRGQTIWRAHFEQSVLGASGDAKRRLFALIDAIDAWVASEQFRADQLLWSRASFSDRPRDDGLREHLTEIERFATGLASAAHLASPGAFGAFVAMNVAGAAAWFDRRAAARAASIGFVERELARRR